MKARKNDKKPTAIWQVGFQDVIMGRKAGD